MNWVASSLTGLAFVLLTAIQHTNSQWVTPCPGDSHQGKALLASFLGLGLLFNADQASILLPTVGQPDALEIPKAGHEGQNPPLLLFSNNWYLQVDCLWLY